jgi:DNA-binding PadR family transcriptional regulator
MRTLKYAILGLINRETMTGYDLMKVFNMEMVNFWYAKHSQIYPELKKLTDEGMITYETLPEGDKLRKKIYSITKKGKADFYHWLLQQDLLEPTPKDIFRLKAYFMESLSKEEMLAHFEYQLKQRQEKLAKLQSNMRILLDSKDISAIRTPEYGDYIVLKSAIMREKMYVNWILECVEEISTNRRILDDLF